MENKTVFDLRGLIVKHTSEMLDNPNKYEIYPTAKFYNNLEKDILSSFAELVKGLGIGIKNEMYLTAISDVLALIRNEKEG